MIKSLTSSVNRVFAGVRANYPRSGSTPLPTLLTQTRLISGSRLKEAFERQKIKGTSDTSAGLEADFNDDEISNAAVLFRKKAAIRGNLMTYPEVTSEYPAGNNMANLIYNGIPFSEVPVVHINAKRSNTMVSVVNVKDNKLIRKVMHGSCGTEGYKDKRSLVASQALGQAIARRALKRKIQYVRVILRGFGNGRESCMKGLYIGGLNIISITDATHIPDYYQGPRPRGVRKM
jgi:small subunit ribosomal protein S11